MEWKWGWKTNKNDEMTAGYDVIGFPITG